MFLLDPTKSYPKRTHSRSVIRFQDCDPLRHLNNAKYFDYYFNAREDQQALLYGLRSDYTFTEYNASWVVYNHQIAYVRPANVSEWVSLFTSVIYFNDTTKVVEYAMADEAGRSLKNLLWTTSKYISVPTGRVISHQPDLMEYLRTVTVPGVDFEHISFNERVGQVKRELAEGGYV